MQFPAVDGRQIVQGKEGATAGSGADLGRAGNDDFGQQGFPRAAGHHCWAGQGLGQDVIESGADGDGWGWHRFVTGG